MNIKNRLRAVLSRFHHKGESLPLCGGGRGFAIAFCGNAKHVRKADRNVRPTFSRPWKADRNVRPTLLPKFNPTEPTTTRLNVKIVEGLSA